MSSSPTAATSTTVSSTSSRSRPDRPWADRVALVACGAIAQPCAEVVAEQGWPMDVFPLPPLLHNAPRSIAGEVERLGDELSGRYGTVAVGYADCGTYGALDELCERRGWRRLPGLHCYDVYGGAERLERLLADQPGTYLLTDFLVRAFDRLVIAELGLDRHPALRDDYFGHYTRMVWLAQDPDPALHALAEAAAERVGLPLTVVETGLQRLARALEPLLPSP